ESRRGRCAVAECVQAIVAAAAARKKMCAAEGDRFVNRQNAKLIKYRASWGTQSGPMSGHLSRFWGMCSENPNFLYFTPVLTFDRKRIKVIVTCYNNRIKAIGYGCQQNIHIG